MGIRFFCPSGHKLNIKEHLAGKVGYCPHCGMQLTIPLVSIRRSSKLGGGSLSPEEIEAEMKRREELALLRKSGKAETQVAAHDATFHDATFDEDDVLHILEDIPDSAEGAEPEVTSNGPPGVRGEVPKVLAEAEIMYIQIPGGKQYGPISGQVVYVWLCEKRLAPDMLLWREGWSDWVEAQKVIPPELFPKIKGRR